MSDVQPSLVQLEEEVAKLLRPSVAKLEGLLPAYADPEVESIRHETLNYTARARSLLTNTCVDMMRDKPAPLRLQIATNNLNLAVGGTSQNILGRSDAVLDETLAEFSAAARQAHALAQQLLEQVRAGLPIRQP